MSYDHGRFVWFELITADADKAKAFYGELFGWKTEAVEMPGGMKYPLVKLGDNPIAGFAPPPKAGIPPHWVSYVSVADVDAAAKKVLAAGGKALMEAFDVPGVGRMQPVTDAEGAALFLFKAAEGDHPAAEGVGAFHWNELWAADAKAAVAFYEKAFGYTHDEMKMPNGTYYLLKSGDKVRGGVMTAPPTGAPPHWTQYITVDDVDAALARAKRGGGKQVGEVMEVEGVGRFGFVQDTVGAVIGIIKPAAR